MESIWQYAKDGMATEPQLDCTRSPGRNGVNRLYLMLRFRFLTRWNTSIFGMGWYSADLRRGTGDGATARIYDVSSGNIGIILSSPDRVTALLNGNHCGENNGYHGLLMVQELLKHSVETTKVSTFGSQT